MGRGRLAQPALCEPAIPASWLSQAPSRGDHDHLPVQLAAGDPRGQPVARADVHAGPGLQQAAGDHEPDATGSAVTTAVFPDRSNKFMTAKTTVLVLTSGGEELRQDRGEHARV